MDAKDETTTAFQEFFKKVPELLKELKSANTSFNEMPNIAVLDGLNAKIATDELNKILALPLDYLGLLVKYEEFAKQIGGAFKDVNEAITRGAAAVNDKTLRNSKIAAFEECFENIESIVIRGKAVVEADRIAQVKTIAYLRGVIENSQRKAMAAKIAAAQSSVTASTKASDIVAMKAALDQVRLRMPDVKYQLLAALFEGLISYNYRAGTGLSSSYLNVDVSADSDARQYAKAYSQIQKALIDSDEKLFNLVWSPDDLVATTGDSGLGQTFQTDWKRALKRDGIVPFTIPLTHPDLDRWSYLRTNSFHAEFYAADGKVIDDVEYWITFGPHFFDRNETEKPLHYMMKPSAIPMVDNKGGKVDTKMHILPTPSCTGSIQFEQRTKHRKMFEDANFSRLDKIAIKVSFTGLKRAPTSSRVAGTAMSSAKVAQKK
ncbi:hypothetical protein LTR17_019739 [Elasticomyces elasticus]|nr:hypothetical protein LTR17_019739 [Elasticomyces elasticus]